MSDVVSLAVEDVATSCVDDLLQLPGARAASLAMFLGPGSELRWIAAAGDATALEGDDVVTGHTLTGGGTAFERAVELKTPVTVPDPAHAPAGIAGAPNPRLVALPVSTGDRRVGVAAVWTEAPGFDPAALILASAICRNAATNLVRAEGYERESRLQSIAARLSSARTINEIGRLLVDHVARRLSADAIVWIDLDPDGLPITIAQGGRPSEIIEHWKSIHGSGEIVPADAARDVAPALSPVTPDTGNPTDPWALYTGIVPVSGSGTIGVVFASVVVWTDDDISELMAMTQIVAEARERALLYESVVRAHRHAERVGALTEGLIGLLSIDEIASTVVQQTAEAIGSHGGALGLTREDGTLQWVMRNGQPDVLLPESATTPGIVADVIAHRRAIYLPDISATFWRFPQTARMIAGTGVEAIAAIPLAIRDSSLGAAVFTFGETQPFRADRRAFLELIARVASVSLERARLHEDMEAQRNEQREARNRAEFLVDLVGRLDATAGFRERIRQLLIGLVPRFADFGSIELLDDAGGIELADAEHRDPQLLPALTTLRREHRLGSEKEGSTWEVADRGITVVRSLTSADYARFTTDPEALALLDRLAPRSVMTVPLGPPGRRIGAVLIGRTGADQEPFSDAEVDAIEGLAQQVGLSLENARLFERSSQVARELQRRMLAPAPIQLPGLTFASHYLPAVDDLEVGGDWFEALELPDGRVGLFVGDVVGRGLGAASAMGQLRAGLSALALACDRPAELLLRLGHFAENVQGAECATVFIGLLDRHTGDFHYVTAAHPPPLVVEPDGTTRLLEGGRSVPLTVATERPVVEAVANIPPGARLVLYTDGLVERKRESLDVGFARLAETATRLRNLDPAAFVATLAEEMVPPSAGADDTAILCVDRSADETPFLWRSASGASALGDLRTRLRGWLDEQNVVAGDQHDILLAVEEAAGNALEHSTAGDAPSAAFEVEVLREGSLLTLRVRDYGAWKNAPAPGARQAGVQLTGGLIDMNIRRSLSGTVVTMTRTLAPPSADAAR